MAFDLTSFEPAIRSRQSEWDSLGVTVAIKPISPNHGKAITLAEFESPEWLISVALWETGELDLDAGRKIDGRLVAKHHDIEIVAELDAVLTEVVALSRDGVVPTGAIQSWL